MNWKQYCQHSAGNRGTQIAPRSIHQLQKCNSDKCETGCSLSEPFLVPSAVQILETERENDNQSESMKFQRQELSFHILNSRSMMQVYKNYMLTMVTRQTDGDRWHDTLHSPLESSFSLTSEPELTRLFSQSTGLSPPTGTCSPSSTYLLHASRKNYTLQYFTVSNCGASCIIITALFLPSDKNRTYTGHSF